MIITVSVALVSAIALAMSNAKKEKVEKDLEFVNDCHMGLSEENRVLNAVLETMEPELESKKKALRELEKNYDELAKAKAKTEERAAREDDIERLETGTKSLIWQRDYYKGLYDQTWTEKRAYKKMYEEATKKAPQ